MEKDAHMAYCLFFCTSILYFFCGKRQKKVLPLPYILLRENMP